MVGRKKRCFAFKISQLGTVKSAFCKADNWFKTDGLQLLKKEFYPVIVQLWNIKRPLCIDSIGFICW